MAGDGEIAASSSFSDLPRELLEEIASQISTLDDAARFSATCRETRSVLPIYSQRSSLPGLLHLPLGGLPGSRFHLFSPWNKRTYDLSMDPDFRDVEILHSKDGWLVGHQHPFRLFVFNPFTGERFLLPVNYVQMVFIGACLSAAPVSATGECSNDWMVFVLSFYNGEFIADVYVYGDEDWSMKSSLGFPSLVPWRSSPVFFNGLFYFLGRRGKVGVFDPHRESWSMLCDSKPLSLGFKPELGFLAEHEGVLFATFSGRMNTSVAVFKLDVKRHASHETLQCCCSWSEVESLGPSKALFVNRNSSFIIDESATSATTGFRGDRVYFSMAHGDVSEPIQVQAIPGGKALFFTPFSSSPAAGRVCCFEGGVRKAGSGFPRVEIEADACCPTDYRHRDECVYYSLSDHKFYPSSNFYLSTYDFPNSTWIVPRFSSSSHDQGPATNYSTWRSRNSGTCRNHW